MATAEVRKKLRRSSLRPPSLEQPPDLEPELQLQLMSKIPGLRIGIENLPSV
jgi:hypothetical protein